MTVAVPQLEMGQGVSTVLAQIVAMELGADWSQVVAEPAPVSGAYANVPLAAKWAALWMPFGAGLDTGGGTAARSSRLARSFAERNRFTATADGTALAAYEGPAREAAGVPHAQEDGAAVLLGGPAIAMGRAPRRRRRLQRGRSAG